jgi:hypothetical protein
MRKIKLDWTIHFPDQVGYYWAYSHSFADSGLSLFQVVYINDKRQVSLTCSSKLKNVSMTNFVSQFKDIRWYYIIRPNYHVTLFDREQ